jgi:predicted nucleotidyltransferase
MTPLDDQTKAQIVARVMKARAERPQRLAEMRQRQQQGLAVARECARILKEQFGAKRVVLFGSLLDPEKMTWRSDIDLAVWGLPEKDFFKAGAAIEHGHDFEIDLVEIQHAKPHILPGIEQGVEL